MSGAVPDAVQRVVDAWKANAAEAGMPEDACCVSHAPSESRAHYGPYYLDPWGAPDRDILDQEEEQPAWIVCCNYERADLHLTYFPQDGRWLYYARNRESSNLIKGGTAEAVANAEIVYTG
jgi:hypothetical protein